MRHVAARKAPRLFHTGPDRIQICDSGARKARLATHQSGIDEEDRNSPNCFFGFSSFPEKKSSWAELFPTTHWRFFSSRFFNLAHASHHQKKGKRKKFPPHNQQNTVRLKRPVRFFIFSFFVDPALVRRQPRAAVAFLRNFALRAHPTSSPAALPPHAICRLSLETR